MLTTRYSICVVNGLRCKRHQRRGPPGGPTPTTCSECTSAIEVQSICYGRIHSTMSPGLHKPVTDEEICCKAENRAECVLVPLVLPVLPAANRFPGFCPSNPKDLSVDIGTVPSHRFQLGGALVPCNMSRPLHLCVVGPLYKP